MLWTPRLQARLASHAWLNDLDWATFLEHAQDGDVLDCKGTIIIVKLHELPEDFETG